MPEKTAIVKTTISIPRELYWSWMEEIPRRRMTQKESIIDAVEGWLRLGNEAQGSDTISVAGLPDDDRQLVRKLIEMMQSGQAQGELRTIAMDINGAEVKRAEAKATTKGKRRKSERKTA